MHSSNFFSYRGFLRTQYYQQNPKKQNKQRREQSWRTRTTARIRVWYRKHARQWTALRWRRQPTLPSPLHLKDHFSHSNTYRLTTQAAPPAFLRERRCFSAASAALAGSGYRPASKTCPTLSKNVLTCGEITFICYEFGVFYHNIYFFALTNRMLLYRIDRSLALN